MRKNRKKTVGIKVVFDRRHTATKSSSRNRKQGSVFIEVYYDTKRTFFSTGIKVYADQFKNERVCNHGQSASFNTHIQSMLNTIETFVGTTLTEERPFSLDALKNYMADTSRGSEDAFLEFMDKNIEARNLADNTRNEHRYILHKLRQWGRIKSFSDLTAENIEAWHEEAVKSSRCATYNVAYDMILGVYVRMAYRKGLIKANPYNEWKRPKYTPHATHRSITLEELRKIEELQLSEKHLIRTRDLFLFQANTGLSFTDTQNFHEEMLRRANERMGYMSNRIKTKEPFYIPLNETAIRILKQYGGRPPKTLMSNYNLYLKRIAQMAGITIPLSSHWARHTFAMICINNGMPVEVLARILGHTNIKTTQIYAQIRQDTVDDAFDEVMRRLEQKS